MYTRVLLLAATAMLLTHCSIAKLGGAAGGNSPDVEDRGRALLQSTYAAMGYDQLATTATYSMTAHFTWSPVWSKMPMNALPGNKNNDLRFRFATGTFDGQVEYLEGKRAGHVYGMQSWRGYRRQTPEAPLEELNSKRFPWGLATYHYLTEAPMRLLDAPVVRYVDQATFDGQSYDRVFVTWGDGTQRRKYDQWLLYINRATGFTDLVEVTITDFFLPMPGAMKHATVRFAEREQTAIGTQLPTRTVIQLGGPKEDIEKDVYTFTFTDFAFDGFDRALLYPLEDLTEYGDSKPLAQ